MYNKREYSLGDLETTKLLFQNIYNNDDNYFRQNNWTVVKLENEPFIEEKNFSVLFKLLNNFKCQGIWVLPILLKGDFDLRRLRKYQSIDFTYLPTFLQFDQMAQSEYFSVTGGLVIDKSLKVAALSDADNCILYLGNDQS